MELRHCSKVIKGNSKRKFYFNSLTLRILVFIQIIFFSCYDRDWRNPNDPGGRNPKGALYISSNPSGATIWLDGSDTGQRTDYLFSGIPTGQRNIRLSKANYADWDTIVSVNVAETTRVNAVLSLATKVGSIQVNSTPTGAAIWLDGINTGYLTNYLLTNVSIGNHILKLTKTGYKDWDTAVTVYENQTTTVNANLASARQVGSIQVNSTPTGAAIWLNGQNTGYLTNYLLTNVPVGNHTIKLTKTGYRDWDTAVTVYENQTTTINVTLAFVVGALKWRFRTGNYVYSSPAIDLNWTIYFGSFNTNLYALNLDSTFKWRYQTGDWVYSSPAIGSDGTIYFGSFDGYLYALNSNGTLKWRYPVGDVIFSSPAIDSDGTIYFGSDDFYFYAINPNGTLKWRFRTDSYVHSSPAIGSDGTIYFGSHDNYLYALNPDGTLRWRYQTGNDVRSSPAIGSDGAIYFGSYDFYLYALNPNGTFRWRYRTGSWVYSSPAIGSDGTIYFGSNDSCLYALNPNGALKWQYKTGCGVWSSPAIGSDGTVYIGSRDGYLYAINPNGTLKWRYATGDYVESSPVIGSDGTIYVGSCDGYLYALQSLGTLANTPWPKFRHDLRNTGRAGAKIK